MVFFQAWLLTMCLATLKLISLVLSISRLATGDGCLPDHFDCGNGQCIFQSWMCDGSEDCKNGNDEKECDKERTPSVNHCDNSLFRCKSDGVCIQLLWRCDGYPDCADGSDEKECVECSGFKCLNQDCIEDSLQCDGKMDCSDGSDEKTCLKENECSSDQFDCGNGKCIFNTSVCDDFDDCDNGNDETECEKNSTANHCDDSKFHCKFNGSCIERKLWCDGTVDCKDGSDEEGCDSDGKPLLFFSTFEDIRALNFTSGVEINVKRTVQPAIAIDVNQRNGLVYWVERSFPPTLYSSVKDGSDLKAIPLQELLAPQDIAVDYIANNIYITDSGLKQVLACRMEGNMCHVIHDARFEIPRSIELDLKERTMYWSHYGENVSAICKSGMDGSGRISFVTADIKQPSGIAIDHTTERLYWADAELEIIKYITLDRSSIKEVQKIFVHYPISLTVFDNNVYWVSWKTNTIESCNKFNGMKLNLVENDRRPPITGIKAYRPALVVNYENPCLSSGCQHMCLLSPVNDFICVCSRGFNLSADRKTCIGNDCRMNEFKCHNGICLRAEQRCDGNTDCEDGSDETNCMEPLDSAIFVSEESSIFYIRAKPSDKNVLTELHLPLGEVIITRVAFDSKTQNLFVADISTPAIHAVNLISNETRVLAENEVIYPMDLAFDWSSSNLYWIDSSKRTAEVISVYKRSNVILMTVSATPVALAISPSSGYMFVAISGLKPAVIMCGMDGKSRKVLDFLGTTEFLHASNGKLFWSDNLNRTIYYAYYTDLREKKVLKSDVDGAKSLAAGENSIYFTTKKRGLYVYEGDETRIVLLPGLDIPAIYRRVSYSSGRMTETSKCLKDNGGCSHVCLISTAGRTCACPSGMLLEDDWNCIRDPCQSLDCSQHCNNTKLGPECACKGGFELDSKDKKTCNDINECQQDGFCSQRCHNTQGGYECSCKIGYELVNRTCKAAGPDVLLYISTIREISAMYLNSMRQIVSMKTRGYTRSFDVHPKNLQMYWVDMAKHERTINTENDNGTSTSILRHYTFYLDDIAVDYIVDNLYITDMRFKEILVCRLDGTMCHVLHSDVGAPHSVALDLDSGLMYWSDWDERIGIHRSGMDGSERMHWVSKNIIKPKSITLDHSAHRLYWADIKLNTIEFITFDRTLRKVILKSDEYQPVAVAVFEDNLYWADRLTYSVKSCNKFSGHNCTLLTQSNDLITKMRLYHPLLQSKALNPCENVCSHMCLISPHNGHLCVCPSGFILSKDRRTCTMESVDTAIFVSEGSSVFYIRSEYLDKDILTKLPLPLGNVTITRVSFDSNSKYLFVATIHESAIFAIDLTFNEVHVLAKNEVENPVDIAFDWSSNNLYWIDYSKRTAEVASVYERRIVVLLTKLQMPVALAISPSSGRMFIAESGLKPAIIMCGMDGKGKKVLVFPGSTPTALHASKSRLFWSDKQKGVIYYANDTDLRRIQILKTGIDEVMSITADENYVYFTAKRRGLHVFKIDANLNGDESRVLFLSGQDISNYRRVSYTTSNRKKEISKCLKNNGGCSHVCLTSPTGRTCACPPDTILDKNNLNCESPDDVTTCTGFLCKDGNRCIPNKWRCDKHKDCPDESDEELCNDAEDVDSELIFMSEGPNIIVSASNATRYNFKLNQYPLGSDAMITSLSYDKKSSNLFVSDANRPAIYILNPVSGVKRELIVHNITSPKDTDFDWSSNNLYWVDSIKGTVEVLSLNNQNRIVLLHDLAIPVSIALSPHSGIMFVSTIGVQERLTVYGMDGKYERILHSVQGVPLSLVLHPSKTILYWTDQRAGMIMYVNYTGSSSPWILKSGINGVMSVAVSEDDVYWTAREMPIPATAGKIFVNKLSEQNDQSTWKSIVLGKSKQFTGKSECLTNNGGCSYICLTSRAGRTCSE